MFGLARDRTRVSFRMRKPRSTRVAIRVRPSARCRMFVRRTDANGVGAGLNNGLSFDIRLNGTTEMRMGVMGY